MKNKFWLVALIGLLLVFVFSNNVFAQSTLSGTFEGGKRSVMFVDNDLFIFMEGIPLTAVTFTVSGNTITLREGNNIVDTWTIIDANSIRDNRGNTLQRINSVSGRFYGQRINHEFRGNVYISYLNTTPLFNGTFTVSGSTISVNGTDIDGKTSSFTFLIIDSNTISDGNNYYRKR